jgi:hypothetical protein
MEEELLCRLSNDDLALSAGENMVDWSVEVDVSM